MNIRVDGSFEGQAAFLEWKDGALSGSSENAMKRVRAEADIIAFHEGLPTPGGFKATEDWLAHPRGFVICAKKALEDASTDWVDHEMDDVILMR